MFKHDNQLDDFFKSPSEPGEPERRESLKDVLDKKPATGAKLRLIPKVLSHRERYIIFTLLVIACGALLSIPFTAYRHFTTVAPDYGGTLVEGIVSKQPRHINPLLSQADNDADRDLTALIFSGLMKYDGDGQIIPDLAKSYEISADGLTYTVYLKENAYWHDGRQITADDVIFSVLLAQNPDYNSGKRVSWQGVEMERVNDFAVMLKLKNKYAQFLNILTMGIIPKHLWEDVKPETFERNELNLTPVGSGPFKFSKIKRNKAGDIESYTLIANKQFYDGRPYIDALTLKFYGSEDDLIAAYNKNEVENIGYVLPQSLDKLKFKTRLNIHQLLQQRIFAVFLNQNQSKVLSSKNVRMALAYATNKDQIISDVLKGNARAIDSPMVDDNADTLADMKRYSFDLELAKKILAEDGWGEPDSNGVLSKKGEKLKVTLSTSTWPELTDVAALLKKQWNAAGFEVEVQALSLPGLLPQVIKERQYESLLFGQILSPDPDPFAFWHSSQKKDPGQNLALYDSKAVDTLLEAGRQTLNPNERKAKYDDFRRIVAEDIPAIFLYSPYYPYAQTRDISGFDTRIVSVPSDRFNMAGSWYVNTKRNWK